MSEIGVCYLARGKDPNWQQRIERFVRSYQAHPAGIDHTLYAIFKEFEEESLDHAREILDQIFPVEIIQYVGHNAYAGGSFMEACEVIEEPYACFLGSSSEIMHDNWLLKLRTALTPEVGVVCCTGSWGFIREFNPGLTYPNYHIRNLSFLMDRQLYFDLASKVDWTEKPGHKLADLNFEHGPNSLTKQLLTMGKKVLVVELDRVREPPEWGDTTYRGNLHNVLVHDRGARDYHDL
jgi:hypothetical protein